MVLVYDDGIGMDIDGLSDLWLVGRSKKREVDYERLRQRKQIGKFGIGKLATYAVAHNVTYVSRTEDQILAVSANFDQFRKDQEGIVPVELPVTLVERSNLQRFGVFTASCEAAGVDVDALLKPTPTSWTIVLLEKHEVKAHSIGPPEVGTQHRHAPPIRL